MEEERSPAALWYRGQIVRLDAGTGRGAVKSALTGREIPFELRFVDLAGCQPAPEVGETVGYDVGWTSRGLRVTRIAPLGEEPPEERPTAKPTVAPGAGGEAGADGEGAAGR